MQTLFITASAANAYLVCFISNPHIFYRVFIHNTVSEHLRQSIALRPVSKKLN